MHKILKTQFGAQMPNIISSTKIKDLNNSFPKLRSPIEDLDEMTDQIKLNTKPASKFGTQNTTKNLQNGLGIVGNVLGELSGGDLTAEQNATREGIRSAIGRAGFIGSLIRVGSAVVDGIGSATGLNLDNIDANAAKRADISGKAKLQNTINSLPGVSMAVGMWGSKTAKSHKSAEVDNMVNAYGGSVANINAAQELSGKRMLGTGKTNKFIKEQDRINDIVTNISLESKLRKSNSAWDTYLSQNQNKYAGHTPQLLLSKKGTKLPELEDARKLISSWSLKSTEKQDPQKFQNGGKIENKNVIPVGELHKNLHHLDDKYPELEGEITKKGIPVIAHSENGIEQCAEIEKHELVLCKPVTEQVEQYYKDYNNTKDESLLIKCGKFVTEQIIKNTIDKDKVIKNTDSRSELIKSIK